MRAAGVPLFSVENHLPARGLRRPGLQPLGRARLHQRAQPGRPGRHPGARRRTAAPTTRWSWPAATAPSTPSRWPTSSTPSCSATARRWSARSPRSSARGRPAGGRRATRRAADGPGPAWPGSTCPALYRPRYERRPAGAPPSRRTGRPRRGREADRGRPGRVALPEAASWCPLTEVVHDRLNVEVFRGCTRGCRFCQAGHDHPAGPRAPGRPGPPDGPRRAGAHRLRRGGPDLAVHGRLLGHRGHRRATSSTTRATASGSR